MATFDLPGYTVSEILSAKDFAAMSILIVEDHAIVRDSLYRLVGRVLSCEGRVLKVLEASSFDSAKMVINQSRDSLDLVLLDLNLPDASTAEITACLEKEWAGLPVVIVSASQDWALVVSLMRLGVLGFIPKTSSFDIIANALRLVFSGGRYFPKEVFDVFEDIAANPHLKNGADANRDGTCDRHECQFDGLSPRQREVLDLMLKGMSNKEISRCLNLSLGTTKNYVAAVLRILGISSRAKVSMAVRATGQGDSLG